MHTCIWRPGGRGACISHRQIGAQWRESLALFRQTWGLVDKLSCWDPPKFDGCQCPSYTKFDGCEQSAQSARKHSKQLMSAKLAGWAKEPPCHPRTRGQTIRCPTKSRRFMCAPRSSRSYALQLAGWPTTPTPLTLRPPFSRCVHGFHRLVHILNLEYLE